MTIHIAGTDQEIFDRVCAHLARQGERAIEAGRCKYRTPDGLRCAIGGLLPEDADYGPLEGLSIEGLINNGLVSVDVNRELLEQLQQAHDGMYSAAELREELRKIARRFGISPAAVETIQRWDNE
jgi:hypothetical protein